MHRTSSALGGLAALALLVSIDISTARACSDAGPLSQHCTDRGTEWIHCVSHADCPTGLTCGSDGTCSCAAACDEEQCDEQGCRCCARQSETTCYVRFACEEPDAGPLDAGPVTVLPDGGPQMDGGPRDAGPSGGPGDPGGGCSVGARAGAVPWALAALLALALRRRRA